MLKVLRALSFLGALSSSLLDFYFEAMLRALSFLQQSAGGIFYFEAMLRALSFLKQSAGGIFTLKLC